jgi:hypothetical protein
LEFEKSHFCHFLLFRLLFLFYIFGAMPSFSKHKHCVVSKLHIHYCLAVFLILKTNALAGFEPGSSVPEADSSSTATSRHFLWPFLRHVFCHSTGLVI